MTTHRLTRSSRFAARLPRSAGRLAATSLATGLMLLGGSAAAWATPTPTPGVSPSASAAPSHRPSPSASAAPSATPVGEIGDAATFQPPPTPVTGVLGASTTTPSGGRVTLPRAGHQVPAGSALPLALAALVLAGAATGLVAATRRRPAAGS